MKKFVFLLVIALTIVASKVEAQKREIVRFPMDSIVTKKANVANTKFGSGYKCKNHYEDKHCGTKESLKLSDGTILSLQIITYQGGYDGKSDGSGKVITIYLGSRDMNKPTPDAIMFFLNDNIVEYISDNKISLDAKELNALALEKLNKFLKIK
ncbi:MAG: hypothetical protein WCI41_00765 [bacterium]